MVRFRVSPFVDQYIQVKVDSQTVKENLTIVSTHLNNLLIGFKSEYSSKVVDCKDEKDLEDIQTHLEEQIKPYEHQVLYLVHSVFKFDQRSELDNEADEKDGDSSDDSIGRDIPVK